MIIDVPQIFSSHQVIVLRDITASIQLTKSNMDSTVYPLYGIRNGITFMTSSNPLITEVSYDASTGVLTVHKYGWYRCFGIGTGYDPQGFSVDLGSVTYIGSDPDHREIPSVCACGNEPVSSSEVFSSSETSSEASSETSSATASGASSESSTELAVESTSSIVSEPSSKSSTESSETSQTSSESSSKASSGRVSTSFESSSGHSSDISLGLTNESSFVSSTTTLSEPSTEPSSVPSTETTSALSSLKATSEGIIKTSESSILSSSRTFVGSSSASDADDDSSTMIEISGNWNQSSENSLLSTYESPINIAGSTYTTTSIHFATATVCPVCTRYSSTWTTTVIVGIMYVEKSSSQRTLLETLLPHLFLH